MPCFTMHEMKAIKEIVDTISKELFSLTSTIDEDLVGMKVRMQELEAQLEIESSGVRMVGIWGGGGSGKTTLASSLYMKISHRFRGHCMVENIREESTKLGLKNLQENVISRLLKTKIELHNVKKGKEILSSRLTHSNVLIILDDVDHIDQLEALVGSRKWFGSGSRIIITTRNEQLLISHKVDQICPTTLLTDDEAIELFNKRAYNPKVHVNDYETLSLSVVSYAAGLPLALKVLGSFLCGKNEEEWRCTLARLKEIPEMEIVETLKISYDGLNHLEKQLFLDIACFFRRKYTSQAMEIFEACGYYPGIGIRVLIQKALITKVDDKFDMHDLVQEMAHHIVQGDHRNNPENHSRVWEDKNITYLEGETMENHNTEAMQVDKCSPSPLCCKMISNMKKLRWLHVHLFNTDFAEGLNFLSNELRYIYWHNYPSSLFPDSFQPMKLVVLRLSISLQNELWTGNKHLPHLKVLQLKDMKNLLHTPDFNGLPCLQKLELLFCDEITEIHPSLGYHTSIEYISIFSCSKLRMFPTIFQMKKLKTLKIEYCHGSLEFPEMKSNMESLVKLSLNNIRIDALLSSIGERCANLISLHLHLCYYLNINEFNLGGLKHLEDFTLRGLDYMNMSVRIPLRHWYGSQISIWLRPLFPQLKNSLQTLVLYGCNLRDREVPSEIGELSNLRELDLGGNEFTHLDFSLSKLTRLKLFHVSCCKQLNKLPKLPSRLGVFRADECCKLEAIGDSFNSCKWLCQVSLMWGSIINDGSRLLESMLEGNANNMVLQFKGFEIAKGFMSPVLIRRSMYRLKLQENWCNDFSGFLIFLVTEYEYSGYVSMHKVMSGSKLEDVVFDWEERESDEYLTSVWYVSFASLSHTTWWDETNRELLFSTNAGGFDDENDDPGIGVRLVARNSGSDPTHTSTTQEEESEFSHYAPKLRIEYDSVNQLCLCLSSTDD